MRGLILYTTGDERSQVKLRAKDQPVWLSQREMAEVFDVSTDKVSLHLKNIFHDGELSREAIPVSFWRQNVDQIIGSNGFPLLTHAGKVSYAQMERATIALYLDYDQRRKQKEARQADAQDEAEPKALENTLKKRPKP
ncbi:hypothetical protein ACUDOC_10275 [Pseudomonas aeruginosa]|uniref:hypothetical protein n=1 Tax=Pseudomonas aeruginosa TaxID=287 RepID=UPI001046FDAB|nr:hypothetical protein [Pseudomonas aeruginosa]MCQ9836282.1 hypothetical protein [Pseudomonas aeruginosa]MCQ9862788.1 hypothetical protein [Pseudomonas aeruginosa]MCS8054526.1 hypothetical protein [Pseudomonas aeruginosa]MCT0835815.1 hypothetical protein [Pseudomonas aeruginosa]HCF2772443.1 hypothetical protein [Pseudomonas aeruginosa]